MGWKTFVQKQVRKFGYEFHKRGNPTLYTERPPYAHATYSPWFDEWFKPVYSAISSRTVVTEDRCYVLHQLALQALHLQGDYAETGVYRGGTAKLLTNLLTNHDKPKRLHLFDTFGGMPTSANDDASGHREGDFGDTSVESVREFLNNSALVEFHPGLIPQTFASVADRHFSFLHVDVDLYQPGLDSCAFFYPRMVSGGFIVFDDYGFPKYEKAMRAAVDTFFADKPEEILVLPTGQCLVTKL